MNYDAPDNIDPEIIDRFVAPLIELVRTELDLGTGTFEIALVLHGLAAATARQDPQTAHLLMTMLAKDMQAAADEVRS